VDEARDRSGRNEALGGSGEGRRCSLLIVLYFSKSGSLNEVDDGRRVMSRGEALNNGTAAEAVVYSARPPRSLVYSKRVDACKEAGGGLSLIRGKR
jgi:hypothetical protein